MATNPSFCSGCEQRGTELGVLRAEKRVLKLENDRLRLKLSLAYAKSEQLEHELHVARGGHHGEKRRDVMRSPLMNHRQVRDW